MGKNGSFCVLINLMKKNIYQKAEKYEETEKQ